MLEKIQQGSLKAGLAFASRNPNLMTFATAALLVLAPSNMFLLVLVEKHFVLESWHKIVQCECVCHMVFKTRLP